MGRAATFGVTAGVLCVVAAAAAAAEAAPRANFFEPGLAPRSPEVMLYFNHSLGAGAGGSMRPTFGLRVQQVRQAANTGDPEAGDSMQHRDLFNWQMEAHSNLRISDLRVKLGDRLTYDVTNRRFGSPASHTAMAIGVPTLRNAPINPSQSRPVFAHNSAASHESGGHDPSGEGSGIKDLAVAAMSALAPSRFTSVQRQIAQHQGGIAGVVAAQRIESPRIAATNAN
jgi:hypothetical protein